MRTTRGRSWLVFPMRTDRMRRWQVERPRRGYSHMSLIHSSRGFEPRSLESGSSVVTAALQSARLTRMRRAEGQLGARKISLGQSRRRPPHHHHQRQHIFARPLKDLHEIIVRSSSNRPGYPKTDPASSSRRAGDAGPRTHAMPRTEECSRSGQATISATPPCPPTHRLRSRTPSRVALPQPK